MNAPAIGMVRWSCWCGEQAMVSGDADSDAGWPAVYAHREEHARERRAAKAAERKGATE